MGKPAEKSERIEALQRLLGRLASPDLTLAEAKDLRGRLFELLGPGAGESSPERVLPTPTMPLAC